jgi:hypothetical protein
VHFIIVRGIQYGIKKLPPKMCGSPKQTWDFIWRKK